MAKHILQEIMHTLNPEKTEDSESPFLLDGGYFNFHTCTASARGKCATGYRRDPLETHESGAS